MRYIGPFGVDAFAAGFAEGSKLRLISKVLKEYALAGKTTKQFEKDYGCKVIMDRSACGIEDIKFNTASNESLFMLKYNT